jgi:hypothetical protein
VIFRRFSQNLRRQDWFALLLDLLIVAVGIYLGLQVDAWNSARQDRATERVYLERLLADMEESVAVQLVTIQDIEVSVTSMDYILDHLSAGSIDDIDDEIATAGINYFGYVALPATNVVTLRELQSTGSISLIRDLSVRESIGRVELSLAEAEFSAATNLSMMSSIMPEVASWSTYVTVDQKKGFHAIANVDYFMEFQDKGFDRMQASPDARQLISWMSSWSKYHAKILARHHEATIEFRDLLRERLEQ